MKTIIKTTIKYIILFDLLFMLAFNIIEIFNILGFYYTWNILGIYFYITLIKCSVGFILLLINIYKKTIIENKKYFMFIIPQIVVSIYLLYNCIKILFGNYIEGGMTITTIIMALGGLCWLCYWILYKNNIFINIILKILLCIIMPVNLIILYIIIWGLIGI